jgi:hypothetical protein
MISNSVSICLVVDLQHKVASSCFINIIDWWCTETQMWNYSEIISSCLKKKVTWNLRTAIKSTTFMYVINPMFKVIMGGKSEILSESFNGTPDWIWQQRPFLKNTYTRGNYRNLHNMLCKKRQHCYLLVDNVVSPHYVWLHRQLARFGFYPREATQLRMRSKQRYFP